MKFRIWKDFGVWWVRVPPRLLLGRELACCVGSRVYHMKTFDGAVRLMDFYRYRASSRILQVMESSRGDILPLVEKDHAPNP